MKTLLLCVTLMVSACHIDPTIEYKIAPELQSFVDKFFEEGEKRGHVIPKENLIMIIYDGLDEQEHAWGQSRKEGVQRVVLIDKEYFEFNRDNAQPLRNEANVFHELGHALLDREHTNTEYSIMNINSCYYTYCYEGQEDLIDELFSGH